MTHGKGVNILEHAKQIAQDAAFNVKTIFEKLCKEKDKETRDKLYKRYDTLRHDIEKSFEEQRLAGVNDYSMENMQDRWTKIKKFVTKAYESGGNKEDEFDADLYIPYFDTFNDNLYRVFRNNPVESMRCFLDYYDRVANINDNNEEYFHLGHLAAVPHALAQAIGRKREFNMLFSNAEFYMSKAHAIKQEFGEGVNLYGTYATNEYNKRIMDLDARKIFEKVAIGAPRDFVIKNDSIDLCIHRFSHEFSYGQASTTVKDIERISKYMREGGILAVYLPISLLYSNLCLAIAKRYDFMGSVTTSVNIKTGSDDKVIGVDVAMLVLRAARKKEKESEQVDVTYRTLMDFKVDRIDITAEDIPEIVSQIPHSPAGKLKIFSGSGADWAIIKLVFADSPLKDEVKQNLVVNELKPLLPLRKGQIGQALVSGKLDGIIDEGKGIKHLIKGRNFHGERRIETEDDTDPQKIVRTTKTIRNNLIEICLVAGDGTIKDIAIAK